MYFPDAIAAVAVVSKKGNDQHNPGEPLHWAREKSTEQMDTAIRHCIDHGTGVVKDAKDDTYHLAKAAWRILAELQTTIEREATNGTNAGRESKELGEGAAAPRKRVLARPRAKWARRTRA
jgi:hypothetical protein